MTNLIRLDDRKRPEVDEHDLETPSLHGEIGTAFGELLQLLKDRPDADVAWVLVELRRLRALLQARTGTTLD